MLYYSIKRFAWQRYTLINGVYVPQPDLWAAMYRRGINGEWQYYSERAQDSWEKAYAVLEKHANPAALAVRFVGTY